MKCLFLAPERYPFIRSIRIGLEANNIKVKSVDFPEFFSKRANKVYTKYASLPKKIKNIWEQPYVKKTNESYRQIFDEYQPGLVFIYNNQLILPDLLDYFKKEKGQDRLYVRR